jgi:hypothetical protein
VRVDTECSAYIPCSSRRLLWVKNHLGSLCTGNGEVVVGGEDWCGNAKIGEGRTLCQKKKREVCVGVFVCACGAGGVLVVRHWWQWKSDGAHF